MSMNTKGTQLLRFLFYVNLDWHLEVKLDQLYSTSLYTSCDILNNVLFYKETELSEKAFSLLI